MISRIALSLTSGLTMLAIALEREASSVWRWGTSAALGVGDDDDLAVVLVWTCGRQLVVEQELDVADVDSISGNEAVLAAGNELVVIDLGLVAGIEIGNEVVVSPA